MIAAALVFVAAVTVAAGPADARGLAAGRLRTLGAGREPPDVRARRRPPSGALSPSATRIVGAAGAGTVVATVVGGVSGLLGGVALAAAAWWWLGRLEPRVLRRRRERVERDVPFAVDLVAGALAAGASVPRALSVAAEAVGGPTGEGFARAAAAFTLGAPATEAVAAWRLDPALAALVPLARLLVRSEQAGTSVAVAATRLAGDLRATAHWRVDAVARRVGVRATAPLGLCFLPAFVLLGVVPLVIGGLRAVSW